MELLLWAERRKLRRSKILWIAGFATVMVALIVFAQGQFTFYERRYIDGAGWFMTAAQSLATFYVLPAVIALLGSYMICREEQEDTLKSLRLIPVDEVKLTLSKMVLDQAVRQQLCAAVFDALRLQTAPEKRKSGQRRAGFGSFRKRKQGKPDRIRKSPFHTYHLLKISNGKISINKKAV